MNICDFMQINVHVVKPETQIKDAAHLMHDHHIGVLPVMKNGQLVGMITDRDICCKVVATGQDATQITVEEVMTKDITTCFTGQSITDVAYLMASHQIRRMAVMDANNKLAGILSVDDIAHKSHDLASIILEASAVPKH